MEIEAPIPNKARIRFCLNEIFSMGEGGGGYTGPYLGNWPYMFKQQIYTSNTVFYMKAVCVGL